MPWPPQLFGGQESIYQRHIRVRPLEDHQHLLPVLAVPPLRIRPRQVGNQHALRPSRGFIKNRHVRRVRDVAIVGHDGGEAMPLHKGRERREVFDFEVIG